MGMFDKSLKKKKILIFFFKKRQKYTFEKSLKMIFFFFLPKAIFKYKSSISRHKPKPTLKVVMAKI
jgi:hypothetical protein